jgi:hypothetical protein
MKLKLLSIVAAGRQTAALLRKIEWSGFLPKAATSLLICLLACQITRAQNSTNAAAVPGQNFNSVPVTDPLKVYFNEWRAAYNNTSLQQEMEIKMIERAATMKPPLEIPEEAREKDPPLQSRFP